MQLTPSTAPVRPPEVPGDPLVGTPYRVLGQLGQGGMGEVFEAEHQALKKRVVVKILRRELAGDPRFVDRLRVEAQALAAVSSPNVVSVSDLGQTAAGRSYLVMERLHGHTLRQELRERGFLPVVEAIGILRQVLAGLAAAHRIGIVHRDVKPDNVFVCAPSPGCAPVVKVLDFGIVKVLRPDASEAPLPAPKYSTEEGMLVGSPRTVSPEQARFQKVDARTDVYASGLLLYALIVGHGPFAHATDVVEVLNAHVREAPAPPSQVAKQPVPPELDRAVLKALAKRPEDRFESAELFAEELARIASALPETTQPLPPPWSSVEASCSGVVTAIDRAPVEEATEPWTRVFRPANLAAGRALGARALLRGGEVHLFALLTLVSTVVFSLIAALLFRYLGGR